MVDNIILLSSEFDLHSFAVKKVLKKRFNFEASIVDFKYFPLNTDITFKWNNNLPCLEFSNPKITITSESSIWWRRPQAFYIPNEVSDKQFREFVENECKTTIDGAIEATECLVINDIFSQRRANNKIIQLNVAKKVGFTVPETKVTNSVFEALEVSHNNNDKAIYKPLSHAKYHVADTRLIDQEFIKRNDLLKLTPTIIQQFIPAEYDLRINVVGNSVFATRILTKEKANLIDWRIALDIPMERILIEESLKQKCLALTKELNLFSGAIDLRVTPNGETYFFEINPSGQFLFCEIDESLDITEAYCKGLLKIDD